ncbi:MULTISPECIES: DUF7344 domain-containing protein [Halorussus]|uniref:DUF7344 domain-containing protein n=1 Tax=Halorussus TaxID=1070314 RepID=UPI0020A1BBD8|nr:hypothetical protein [Halorussus vallis]USZ75326.1 hypothetical protein NGM07_18070 [Halorussus vallis]
MSAGNVPGSENANDAPTETNDAEATPTASGRPDGPDEERSGPDRTPGDSGEGGADLTREIVFEMLSNGRRRHVVHYLLAHDEESELRDLSRELAAWENDKSAGAVTAEERRRVYNALQQSHLPKLDDAGLVRYDAARGTVAATDDLTDLQVYLEIVPGDEIPWSQYYALLGAFCASMTLAAWVGVSPFAGVPALALAGVTAALFACSAAVHAYYARTMRLGSGGPPPSVRK